jgi:hypothetical protein
LTCLIGPRWESIRTWGDGRFGYCQRSGTNRVTLLPGLIAESQLVRTPANLADRAACQPLMQQNEHCEEGGRATSTVSPAA